MTQPADKGKNCNPKPTRFEIPGYSGVTAALIDIIRFGPELLGVPATLVLLFLAERTVAYRKLSDAVSLTQMVEGVYTKVGGSIRWTRHGCGLKLRAAVNATSFLVKNGLLEKQKRSNARKGNLPTQYAIRWDALHSYFIEKSATKLPPLVHHMHTGSPESKQIGLSKELLCTTCIIPSAPSAQEQYLDLNNTGTPALTQSSPVPHHHQGKEKLDSTLSSLAFTQDPLNRTTTESAESNTECASPLSRAGSVDDDEKQTGQISSASGTPTSAFLARLEQRHPKIDVKACLADVKGELHEAAVPLEAFLSRDLVSTTNPKALTNPRGYYRYLAKKMVAEHRRLMAGVPAEGVVETPRCAKCNGSGYLLERIEGLRPRPTGEFCTCKLGEDLAAIERRAAKKAVTAVERKAPGKASGQTVMSAVGG